MQVIPKAALKARSFKGLGHDQGFEAILPVNVIVGRNNSGKTTVMDMVESFVLNRAFADMADGNNEPEITLSLCDDVGWLTALAAKSPHSDKLTEIVGYCKGKQVDLTFNGKKNRIDKLFESSANLKEAFPPSWEPFRDLVTQFRNTLRWRRVAAERNIVPEATNKSEREVRPNGDNATILMECCLHEEGLDHRLITRDLLLALNNVFRPDDEFEAIDVLRKSGLWEVFITPRGRSPIRLSRMGSGLKTVIVVLLNLLVMPKVENAPASSFVYGFEELENNLHPSLQRRLLGFIRDFVKRENATAFITTHSSVALDLFSNDSIAQVVHVVRDGSTAIVQSVTGHNHSLSVVTDLGIRASDLLMTNAVVWVEGPSDRVYFNQWMKLSAGDYLREHAHYEVLFLGGKCGAHFGFGEPSPPMDAESEKEAEEAAKNLIQALRVNPHAVILCDSDRAAAEGDLKKFVDRIREEAEKTHSEMWITAGREVENYIPLDSVNEAFKLTLTELDPHIALFDVLVANGKANFRGRKVELAEKIAPLLKKDSLTEHLGFGAQMEKVCKRIAEWNDLPWPPPAK
jgi:hypothetical protein